MAGPTWTPVVDLGSMAGLSDEEAESRLLAPFLFGAPDVLPAQAEAGSLVDRGHRLQAWLTMVTGRGWEIGTAVPATSNGGVIYLPPSLPGAAPPAQDELAYQIMALLQADVVSLGFFGQREWMRELHRDWVLQVCAHLLMVHAALGRWPETAPGLVGPRAELVQDGRLCDLWVGRKCVSDHQLPAPFAALLDGLAPVDSEPVSWVEDAISAVESASQSELLLVLPGAAQRLREAFRRVRLGAPPVPFWVGAIHPAWFLEDAQADMRRANEWKQGPKPLRKLLLKVRQKEIQGETAPEMRFQEPPTTIRDADEFRYDEWNHGTGTYRCGFARIVESDAPSGPQHATQRIVDSHQAELAAIRYEFEQLKVEQRWLHGQPDGSELDIDRVVHAAVDIRAKQPPERNLYLRFQNRNRPMAVLTLVDLSGSTQGSVLAEEQRAVILFAEALRTLNVPHAFFGFSSEGAQACHFLRIRDWADDDVNVAKRMGSLVAGGGSRLGVYIRHATAKLAARPEDDRLLIVLSDGRPEDRDGYRGTYGVADTAVAVREAVKCGVHIHCVSMEGDDAAYLKTIFGPDGYTVVSSAGLLASRLPMVFRSLTRR